MVIWNSLDWLKTVLGTPIDMRSSFIRTIKISFDVFSVQGIIYYSLIARLDSVVVVAERYVKTSVTDISIIIRVAYYMSIADRLPNLTVAIYPHVTSNLLYCTVCQIGDASVYVKVTT